VLRKAARSTRSTKFWPRLLLFLRPRRPLARQRPQRIAVADASLFLRGRRAAPPRTVRPSSPGCGLRQLRVYRAATERVFLQACASHVGRRSAGQRRGFARADSAQGANASYESADAPGGEGGDGDEQPPPQKRPRGGAAETVFKLSLFAHAASSSRRVFGDGSQWSCRLRAFAFACGASASGRRARGGGPADNARYLRSHVLACCCCTVLCCLLGDAAAPARPCPRHAPGPSRRGCLARSSPWTAAATACRLHRGRATAGK